MRGLDDFIRDYVPYKVKDEARQVLRKILDDHAKQIELSEIMPPTGHGTAVVDELNILEIGEDADQGFYVVTANVKKAQAAAKKYMTDYCGMDEDLIANTLENYRKMRLHLYTKPWEEGELADYYFYQEHSDHPKAEYVVKFEYA